MTESDITGIADHAKVDGLLAANGQVVPQTTFSESGDVFNHRPWRRVFDSLGSMETSMSVLLSLSNSFLIRGKEMRKNNSKKTLSFSFSLKPEEMNDEARLLFPQKTVTLYVHFADGNSKVGANCLTPERLKCVLRNPILPIMMNEMRFPSVSESIGYGHMVRSFASYYKAIEDGIRSDIRIDHSRAKVHDEFYSEEEDKKVTEEQWAEMEERMDEEYKAKGADTEKIKRLNEKKINDLKRMKEAVNLFNLKSFIVLDYLRWAEVMNSNDHEYKNLINMPAAVSATFSTKEIYQDDETKAPGCIWFAGVHSMMTDAANKIRASKVPADQRMKLENSSFYPDFKKKMSARGISIIDVKEYVIFLKSMIRPMKEFMRAGTGMTQEEAQIFDIIVAEDKSIKTAEVRPSVSKIAPTNMTEYKPTKLGITRGMDMKETVNFYKKLTTK